MRGLPADPSTGIVFVRVDEAGVEIPRLHAPREGEQDREGDRRHQHHAFGAEVEHAGAFVDQEAERREREHGARGARKRKAKAQNPRA